MQHRLNSTAAQQKASHAALRRAAHIVELERAMQERGQRGALVQEARLYLRTAANELATQATLAHDEAQFAQQRAVANEKHVNQAAAELKVAAARVARIARDVADNRSFTDNAVPSPPL